MRRNDEEQGRTGACLDASALIDPSLLHFLTSSLRRRAQSLDHATPDLQEYVHRLFRFYGRKPNSGSESSQRLGMRLLDLRTSRSAIPHEQHSERRMGKEAGKGKRSKEEIAYDITR